MLVDGILVDGILVDDKLVDGILVDGIFVDGIFVDGIFVDGIFVVGIFVVGPFVKIVEGLSVVGIVKFVHSLVVSFKVGYAQGQYKVLYMYHIFDHYL